MFGPNSDPKYPHILFVNIAIILLIHHATPSLIGLNASWMVKTQALMSSVGTPRVSYLGEDPDSCGVRGMTFGFHQTSILVWKCCIPKWILKWLFSRENGLINQYTSVNLEPIFQPSRCTKPFVPTSRMNSCGSQISRVNIMNFPKLEDAWFIMILHAGGERRKASMTKKRNWEVKVVFWTFGLCNQSESIEQWLRSTAVGWWLLRWWYYPIYTGLIIIHSPPKL